MLDELLKILDFDGRNPEIRDTILKLMDTDLDREQIALIYDLAAYSYELGKREA